MNVMSLGSEGVKTQHNPQPNQIDSKLRNGQKHLIEPPCHFEARRNAVNANHDRTDIGLRYYYAQGVYINVVDHQCRVGKIVVYFRQSRG